MNGIRKHTDVLKKKSIIDVPNELLIEIFEYLDVPSRFRLRLNKRLDQFQLSIPNQVEKIKMEVNVLNLEGFKITKFQNICKSFFSLRFHKTTTV